MKTYKVIINNSAPEGVVVEAESVNEAVDLVKAQLGLQEISGDIGGIEVEINPLLD